MKGGEAYSGARVSDEESGEGGQRWTPVMLPEVSDGDGG
jgi:hypothetical protein